MKQNLCIHTLLAVLLPLLVLLGGCLQEETFPRDIAAGVTISYSFDDLQTRSISATPEEKKFSDVYFVFYKASTGAYVAYQKTSAPAGNTGEGSFPLPIPQALVPGNTYRTLIVANYDRYKADGKTFDVYIKENRSKSYDQMQQDMKSQALNKVRVTAPLPLFGTLLGKDGQESLFTAPEPDATGKLPVSVRFSRAVSRFDLKNRVADKLVIAWVKVCNYRDAGYFFHQDAPLGDLVKGTAAKPPADVNNLPEGYVKVNPPMGDPATMQDMVDGGLYAYPNIVANALQDDESTTCLMIAGYYQDPLNGTPNTDKLTYYRANVADPGLSQVLKRNYAYTIVITGVQRAGSDTEDEAMAEKDRLLDYVVDDQWQDDGDNTVVDGNGNFLSVSRTAVVLDPPAGEAATIKVSVKEGLGWETVFRQNEGDAFKVEKVDEHSFLIMTNKENNTDFVNTAQLEVRATGIPSPGDGTTNILKITINITQLSIKNEVKMLSVEGQTGTLTYEVPGQGATLSLQVLTGGAYASWTANPDPSLSGFIGDYTTYGANKARIQITFQPNVTNAPRSGTLTVNRSPDDGIPPVTINFTQKQTDHLVTIFPNFGDQGLTLEGFSPDPGNPNGVVLEYPFWVSLADGQNYNYKVESNFRADTEAFLTYDVQPVRPQAAYTASADGTILQNCVDGKKFTLSIFRTGPGDADLTRSIKVTAVPKTAGGKSEEVSFNVTIQSSCDIGDVTVGGYTIADRNVGAPLKTQATIAGNYSTNRYSPDNGTDRKKWTGTIIKDNQEMECKTFGQQNYGDGNGWMPADATVLNLIKGEICTSRERVFSISGAKKNGRYVACYWPEYAIMVDNKGQTFTGWYVENAPVVADVYVDPSDKSWYKYDVDKPVLDVSKGFVPFNFRTDTRLTVYLIDHSDFPGTSTSARAKSEAAKAKALSQVTSSGTMLRCVKR